MNHSDKTLLDRYIPITDWLRDYNSSYFKKDLRAGLTVGILLIPQSMAYAMLAGLPPVYGSTPLSFPLQYTRYLELPVSLVLVPLLLFLFLWRQEWEVWQNLAVPVIYSLF